VPSRRNIVYTSHVTFNKSSIITFIGSAEDEILKEMPLFTENRNRNIEENPFTNNNDIPKISINRDREKIYILDYDNTLLSNNDFADTKKTLRITKLSNNDK
jgi:hypothetical protein